MAITQTINASNPAVKTAFGKFLDSAGSPATASIECGFKPSYIKFVNLTDRISYEFFEGMTAAHSLKIIADGTATEETSGGFTLESSPTAVDLGTGTGTNTPGPDIEPHGFKFATITQNKQYYWYAIG